MAAAVEARIRGVVEKFRVAVLGRLMICVRKTGLGSRAAACLSGFMVVVLAEEESSDAR